MRKFVYLCCLTMMSLSMAAQIDTTDRNWEIIINEDFSGNRNWDRHWDDSTGVLGYKPLWRCFSYNLWHTGVIKPLAYYGDHSAYQRSNAVFGSDNTMKLIGQFKSQKKMTCEKTHHTQTTYYPAPWHKYCHTCDSIPPNQDIHYHSGMIESTDSLGFGYYEIKCKMPIHRGSHDAFWFWSDYGKYEEIDVFEHSAFSCEGDTAKGFSSGIFYNPDGPNYLPDTIEGVVIHGAYHLSSVKYHTPPALSTLDQYHTYGCLWLPERIAWYFDGILFNEETDPSHIPQHPMWLKITHYQDDASYTTNGIDTIWWQGTDEMTIDYVKYYQLKTNCNIDIFVRTLSDFNHFDYRVMKSITLGGVNSTLVIPNNVNFTMRAVESITIDSAFEVPQGTEMTLIIQNCPACSQEGLYFHGYCPF